MTSVRGWTTVLFVICLVAGCTDTDSSDTTSEVTSCESICATEIGCGGNETTDQLSCEQTCTSNAADISVDCSDSFEALTDCGAALSCPEWLDVGEEPGACDEQLAAFDAACSFSPF